MQFTYAEPSHPLVSLGDIFVERGAGSFHLDYRALRELHKPLIVIVAMRIQEVKEGVHGDVIVRRIQDTGP